MPRRRYRDATADQPDVPPDRGGRHNEAASDGPASELPRTTAVRRPVPDE